MVPLSDRGRVEGKEAAHDGVDDKSRVGAVFNHMGGELAAMSKAVCGVLVMVAVHMAADVTKHAGRGGF